jgi:hypothetical protein
MSWPLYMDHHVPWAVTSALRQRGHDVLTADEDHAAEQEDEALLERATNSGRMIVTQDAGFHRLASEWRKQGRTFFNIIYSPQERLTIGEFIEWLELVATTLGEDEIRNQVIFLPPS